MSGVPSLSEALYLLRAGRKSEALHELRRVIEDHFSGSGVAVADEATSLARDGFVSDAICRLERYLEPKWHNLAECHEDYEAAMHECGKLFTERSGWHR